MRNPNDIDEYKSVVATVFFVVSIFMILPISIAINIATITFLSIGICLFITAIVWIIWALSEHEMNFDWMFEKEDEIKG